MAALLAFPLLVVGACSTEQEGESVEMSTEAILTQPLNLRPASASASNIAGVGCSSTYWQCVDDGTSYSASDDTRTMAEVTGSSTGTHTLGFSNGTSGAVGQVTAHFRASTSSSSTKGTIQVKLYDGSTLIGTGPVHSVSSGWANFDDSFSGLHASAVKNLKTAVLLHRTSGSGAVRYTMLWITATGANACNSNADCSGSTPSCNMSSHTCTCRIPSAGNLLQNPGFDGSFSGWTVYYATLAADSEGCSASNSAYVDNDEASPQQCVPLTGGRAYYFGGKFMGGNSGNDFHLDFYTGANCTGSLINGVIMYLAGSTGWAPVSTSFVTPSGTTSVLVGFYGMQQYLDQLYVNTSNQF
jgi:hypothetical protein